MDSLGRPNRRDYSIFSLDERGRVTSWNDHCEQMKGYRHDEIIGRHFSIFYPAEKRASGYPDKALRWAAKYGFCIDDGWRVRKDGSQFWAHIVITAQRGPNRELTGFVKITRDDGLERAQDEEPGSGSA